VAALPSIRSYLTSLQREMAACTNVVMEGRDIGTVVLPNATYKFFLTASVETRAKRRFLELSEKNPNVSLGSIQREIVTRDKLDSSRIHAPLCKAEDAIEIDTTNLGVHEVIQVILAYLK